MGYTVATPIRNEQDQALMFEFLFNNFRHWDDLRHRESRYYRGPSVNGDLDYDKGPCRIGFDFSTSGFEREYIFAVCRWMALKVGRVDTFPTKCRPEVKGAHPVIAYDGDEATRAGDGDGPWPVILGGEELAEEVWWCTVSTSGAATTSKRTIRRSAIVDGISSRSNGSDLMAGRLFVKS